MPKVGEKIVTYVCQPDYDNNGDLAKEPYESIDLGCYGSDTTLDGSDDYGIFWAYAKDFNFPKSEE